MGLPGGSSETAPQPATAAARQSPKPGGTLRVGRLEDISLVGIPHLLAPSNFQVSNLVYDTLVEYDDQLVPRPRLATSWEWSPDFLQLSLQLRQGVRFHTGRPFTSADAKFNLERLRDPSVGSQFRNYANLMKVTAPAEDKLGDHLRRADAQQLRRGHVDLHGGPEHDRAVTHRPALRGHRTVRLPGVGAG